MNECQLSITVSIHVMSCTRRVAQYYVLRSCVKKLVEALGEVERGCASRGYTTLIRDVPELHDEHATKDVTSERVVCETKSRFSWKQDIVTLTATPRGTIPWRPRVSHASPTD